MNEGQRDCRGTVIGREDHDPFKKQKEGEPSVKRERHSVVRVRMNSQAVLRIIWYLVLLCILSTLGHSREGFSVFFFLKEI